ncbi:MAG: MBL fold metallo-hydrolase [Candidatus Aenigmarchaeota archaeon]|nr:MBL fold metallo-hydrolase [Candidatus Aenigmarchaeota archaeon]
MIKITVLHNEPDEFVEETSGFSVLIETKTKKILFDTSYSDDIIENARKGKINLSNIDYLVLSHGHIDHTEGLKFVDFSEVKTLLAHPDCFQKKYFKGAGYVGIPFVLDYLRQKTKTTLTKEPYWLDENKIVFLGQIPRKTDFEAKEPVGCLETGEDDFVLDDSAIAIKTDKGLVIISGCSHSGICNIIEYAKEVCDENKIYAILGGFHLFNKETTDKTIEFIKNQNHTALVQPRPKGRGLIGSAVSSPTGNSILKGGVTTVVDIEKIHPSHCLDKYAFSEFKKIGGERIHTLQELFF